MMHAHVSASGVGLVMRRVTLDHAAGGEGRPQDANERREDASGSDSGNDMDLQKALNIVAKHYSKRNVQIVACCPSPHALSLWRFCLLCSQCGIVFQQ